MDDILKQIKAGEVSGVQFKERILDKYDIGCELVAMSNYRGGQLVTVGLLEVCGIEVPQAGKVGRQHRSVGTSLVLVARTEQGDVGWLQSGPRAGRPQPWFGSETQQDGQRHVGGLPGRRGPAVVEVDMPVEVHQGDVVTVVAQTAEHARQQRAAAAEDQQWRLRFGAPGDPLTQFGGQADDVFACHDARFVVTDRVAQAAAGVTEVDQRGPVADPGVPLGFSASNGLIIDKF